MTFAHGYALLIGVNENSVPKWALPDVAKDITALKAVLTHSQRCAYKQENVNVLTGQNATKANIMAGLDWLKEKLSANLDGNTTALIYYSGHGWQDNSLSQPAHYLIPFDVTKEKLRQTALRADDFAAEIAAFSPRRLLVVLDCCHSSGMGVKDIHTEDLAPFAIPPAWFMSGQNAITVEDRAKDINLALLAQGSGRAVLNSSRSDERSYIRKDGKMSIFTYHLIEALTGYAPHRDEDREVTVADVLSYVWRTVPESANNECHQSQHPDGQLSGNFPIALLLGGEGASASKSLPDPSDDLLTHSKSERASIFDQRGQTIYGSQKNININGGDYVGRDKIDNSIHVGDVVGNTGVSLGYNASNAFRQSNGVNAESIATIFAKLQKCVDTLPDENKKEDIRDVLEKIKEEAQKGEKLNESRVIQWLSFLAGMSKDIFDVAIATFSNPINGLSTTFSKIAQRAKEEQNRE